MGWRSTALRAFDRLGGSRATARLFGRDRVTVLAYHRVVDHRAEGFFGFIRNVSARPEAFAAQMELVARSCNPVGIDDLTAALDGHALPERAVLVTFDDGYRDNHDAALPVLARHSIPAVVFLATDHIGSSAPFWWDRVAWLFEQHGPGSADLPILGPTSWNDPHWIAVDWVGAAKRLEAAEKDDAVAALGTALDGPDSATAGAGAHLDWDMVRSMQAQGVAFGAHTCSHPLLARIGPEAVRREVTESIRRVEAETGRFPVAFAYPNGLPGDFGDDAVAALRAAGVRLGFTLSPGPARRREFLADPLRIRRVYVHHGDDLARFKAKCAGLARLVR